MNEPPLNRWNTGIAIRRWRVPLIAVLLIAVAIGVSLEGLAYLRAQGAKCVIQYRGSPSMSLDNMQKLILSDAFLEETRLKAGSGFPPSTVKKLVRCESIKGTSLLIISAKGWNTPAKAKLCNALGDLANAKAIAHRDKADTQKLETMKACVESLEVRVEASSQRLSDLLRYEHPLHYMHAPRDAQTPRESKITNTIKEIKEGSRELMEARVELMDKEMRGVLLDSPVEIHEPAGPPRPISIAEILPSALRLSTWIGSGFLAALILVFLLEAMRRTPQKPVIYE